MPRVFVSYRHEDSGGFTDRLCDRLISRFGSRNVFHDLESIPSGVDYPVTIDDALSKCDVLLAVIGRRWLNAAHADGRRRLDDSDDFVVREIGVALERGIRCFPVLVDGARMPSEEELPARLAAFATKQAHVLSNERSRWRHDVKLLIKKIKAPPVEEPRRRRWLPLAAVLILAAGALVVWRLLECPPSPQIEGRPRVIAIMPFTSGPGDQELIDDLRERVRQSLGRSRHVQVAAADKVSRVGSAARGAKDIRQVAAAAGIDYLLQGTFAKGRLEARVTPTDGSLAGTPATLYGLEERTLAGDAQTITELARRSMGLSPTDLVGTWTADFGANYPRAHDSYVSGLKALHAERYDEAQSHFENALNRDRCFTMARYGWGWAHAFAGNTEAARDQMRKAADAGNLTDREAQYVEAADQYFSDDYEAALEAYDDLIKRYPDDIEPRHHRAELLNHLHRPAEAAQQWEEIRALAPAVVSYLADIYLDMKQVPRAVRVLEEALKVQEDARTLAVRGAAYQVQGELGLAAQKYDEALAANPTLADVAVASSTLEAITGQSDKAKARLGNLVSNARDAAQRIEAAFELAFLHLATAEPELAAKVLEDREEEIASEGLREALALSVRGVCAMEAGDLRGARLLIERAIEKAPPGHSPTPYLFTRGLLQLRLGFTDWARRTAAEIRRTGRSTDEDRRSEKAADYLEGMAQLAEGRAAAAVEILKRAVELKGYEFKIYRLGLARAYLALGQPQEALAAAEAASQLSYVHDLRLDLETDRKQAALLAVEVSRALRAKPL